MTDDAQAGGAANRAAIGEAIDWVRRYLQNHPIASLSTAGGQIVLGLRTLEYLFFDIIKGRFQVREFLDQAAFMAGTAFTPTVLVTIPISVTLSIQFALLAGQVGASSLSGAATGLVVIRQGAPLVASLLLATAVGSAVCADLGSRTMREEISAMEVMGVSPIQRLVVPRLVALVLIGVADRCHQLRRLPGELHVQRLPAERHPGLVHRDVLVVLDGWRPGAGHGQSGRLRCHRGGDQLP